jgi:hypothetical protein
MLQGDDLSVQLFIGSLAVNALGVAMTQAGWTHRWFVRGMFVLAALLGIGGLGWRYVEARIPLLDGPLQVAASSRTVWFVSGIVPALIVGMMINDLLRSRRANLVEVLPPGWLSVNSANQTFARKDLLDRYNYIVNEIHNVSMEHELLNHQIAALSAAIISDVDDVTRSQWSDDLARLSERRSENREKGSKFISTQVDCSEALRVNIIAQLQEGKLIAKGFLAPHRAGEPERIIPTDEWRFLTLDDQADQARGPNFEYLALLIGNPDR